MLLPSFTYLHNTLENGEINYVQIELLAEARTAEPVWLVSMGSADLSKFYVFHRRFYKSDK